MKKTLKYIYDIIPFKKQLFLFLRLFPIKERTFKHLHFKGKINIKIDKTHSFKINHYGYQIENEIFWSGLTGGWEKISMQLWVELCKFSESIVDVGANTGIYSLAARCINPTAKVYGFEPVERVYQKYVANCKLNNYDIKCFETALSNYNGEAVIYDTPNEHVYSVTVNKNNAVEDRLTIETKIKAKKLSTFIEELNITKIDLIKIDVETHEPEVLEGMEKYLAEFKPTLLIEILTDEVGARVENLLKGMDYLYFNIDEIGRPQQVDKITKSHYFNYLICNKSIAGKLNLL